MSGISQNQKRTVAELQAEFLMKGQRITRCPTHAPQTGYMRYQKRRIAQPDDPQVTEV